MDKRRVVGSRAPHLTGAAHRADEQTRSCRSRAWPRSRTRGGPPSPTTTADTIHAVLLGLTPTGGLHSRSIVVLDEAGMAPTRLTARLFELADAAGAKVIAVRDPGSSARAKPAGGLAALTAHDRVD